MVQYNSLVPLKHYHQPSSIIQMISHEKRNREWLVRVFWKDAVDSGVVLGVKMLSLIFSVVIIFKCIFI